MLTSLKWLGSVAVMIGCLGLAPGTAGSARADELGELKKIDRELDNLIAGLKKKKHKKHHHKKHHHKKHHKKHASKKSGDSKKDSAKKGASKKQGSKKRASVRQLEQRLDRTLDRALGKKG
jgi:hypothetical protein